MASLALNLKTKPGPHKNYTSWSHVLADCALDISEGTLQWTTTVGSVCEGIWGGLESTVQDLFQQKSKLSKWMIWF